MNNITPPAITNPIVEVPDEKEDNKENTLPTNTPIVASDTYTYKDNVIIDEKRNYLDFYNKLNFGSLTPDKQKIETVKAHLATLYILNKLAKFNNKFTEYISEIKKSKQDNDYTKLNTLIKSYYNEMNKTYNINKKSKPFTLFGASRRAYKKRNTRNKRRMFRQSKVRRYNRRSAKTSKR
jgi:hypothetical protein